MSKNDVESRQANIYKYFTTAKKRAIILQLFSIALLRARVKHARTH